MRAWHLFTTLLLTLALTTTSLADDVSVELRQLGVGNHVRPGDPTGMLVRLTSNLTEPVQTRVQWELRNADGDTALYSRDVPLAPGSPTDRWLYGVVPITSASAMACIDTVTIVRVLQIEDSRVVRELAVARLSGGSAQAAPVEVSDSLIGVLGDGRAGLAPFAPQAGMGSDTIASMNEVTRVAGRITADTLPDRWEGLQSYAALIWGNAAQQNLGPEQARALLDWVRRGGNLILLMPDSGDPWGLLNGRGGRTPLADVLPQGGVVRHEGVLVKDLMPLISRTPELRNESARTALWTFDPAAVGNGYEVIMAMPCNVDPRTGNLNPQPDTRQGQPVAVRRQFGFGTIAVVGIDADGLDRRALTPHGLPQADIFWNRLIGRRADAPGALEWTKIEAEKRRLSQALVADLPADGGRLIISEIGMRGAAAIGVLGLIVAFGAYWLLAGPGVYYILRSMRKVQYAWFGFVLIAMTATAVAWMATGVNELTGGRVKHITYLDRVDSMDYTAEERAAVRAVSWFSAQLPGYGPTRVSLKKGIGGAGADNIWTWFAPPQGSTEGFPDTERYQVPLTSPADYEVPSRATTTVLSSSWMGAPPSSWSELPSVMKGSQLRQEMIWDKDEDVPPDVILRGNLIHNLPGTLENVLVIHINPMRSRQRTMVKADPLREDPSDALPNYGVMQTVSIWSPNTPLDVALTLYYDREREPRKEQAHTANDLRLNQNLTQKFINPIVQQNRYDMRDVYSAEDRLTILNFYNMLPQPEYLVAAGDAGKDYDTYARQNTTARVARDMGRTLDMSMWFTRPCLIVIGTLKDDSEETIDPPFPIEIDGDTPKSEGRTVVRVVFPLPDVPGTIPPPLTAPTP